MCIIKIIKPCLMVGLFAAEASAQSIHGGREIWEFFAEGESLTYSESLPISNVIGSFRSERFEGGGDAAFTHNRALFGTRRDGWEFAALLRYDYGTDYSQDLARFINATVNDREIADGDIDVVLKINHSRGIGGRVGYRWQAQEGLELAAFTQLFRSDRTIDGDLRGQGRIRDGELDTGVAEIDYFYTDDLLLQRDLSRRSGWGGALDLSANYQHVRGWGVRLDVFDAFGRIRWGSLDRTVADADLTTLTRDQDGLILVRPTLRGRNSVDSHTQSLRTRYRVGLDVPLSSRITAHQTLDAVGGTRLWTSGIDYEWDAVRIGPRVEWASGAIGFALEGRGFHIKALSDRWSESSANYAQLSVGAAFNF